jgi:MFS family permease
VGGERSIGALTGLYYLFASAAAITGPIVAGALADLFTTYLAIWPFAAIFMILAWILFSRIHARHGEASNF